MPRKLITISLVSFVFISTSFATVYHAVEDGDWTDITTWDVASYPSDGDSVYIDGYDVTVDISDITVQYIALTDSSDVGNTKLTVTGNVKLTVTGSVDIISDNFTRDLTLEVLSSGTMEIGGSLFLTRLVADNASNTIKIKTYSFGVLRIIGDMIFDYNNTGSTSGNTIVELLGKSTLEVSGNVNVNIAGGSDFLFESKEDSKFIGGSNFLIQKNGGEEIKIQIHSDSTSTLAGNMTIQHNGGIQSAILQIGDGKGEFYIDGNLTLESTIAGLLIDHTLNGSNTICSVAGNIILTAQSEGDVSISMESSSELKLGGSFSRANYGSLTMDSGTSLTYNGTGAQTIAANDIPNSGTDEFIFADVFFENTSGMLLSLEDTMTVEDELTLTSGIIETTATKPIILEDQAMILGGSETAYIDGPIIKRGRSSGIFTFPLGDNNKYAPLQLSQISNSSSTYVAEYMNCPPPIGSLGVGIGAVSSMEHWTFDWTSGSTPVDHTLHWMNADASGINDLDSLLVVQNDGVNGWVNMGNKATSGGSGQASGTVTSDGINCPPPIGSLSITFGTTNINSNPLPVEMTRFEARQENPEEVILEWETVTEFAFSHFEIEKSTDALEFEYLGTVRAVGDENQGGRYQFNDKSPFFDKNYYRLKLLDDNGMYTYSEVESVNFYLDKTISIFPNPVKNQINLRGLEKGSIVGMLEIYNQAGQIIYQNKLDFREGELQISTADVNIKSAGAYYLQVMDGKGKRGIQFVKL